MPMCPTKYLIYWQTKMDLIRPMGFAISFLSRYIGLSLTLTIIHFIPTKYLFITMLTQHGHSLMTSLPLLVYSNNQPTTICDKSLRVINRDTRGWLIEMSPLMSRHFSFLIYRSPDLS